MFFSIAPAQIQEKKEIDKRNKKAIYHEISLSCDVETSLNTKQHII